MNHPEISTIYVAQSVQGQGIGRQLMAVAATHLSRVGMTALRLGVLTANAPARGFYEAMGGQVVGEREFNEEGFMLPEIVYEWSDIQTLRLSQK